ncbi:hypothetical protein A3753_22305 [Sulfitobacter sp. HI0082]|nr:hypothetical protein A3753_22305 [Sulfitobacter sp. HI0082]
MKWQTIVDFQSWCLVIQMPASDDYNFNLGSWLHVNWSRGSDWHMPPIENVLFWFAIFRYLVCL